MVSAMMLTKETKAAGEAVTAANTLVSNVRVCGVTPAGMGRDAYQSGKLVGIGKQVGGHRLRLAYQSAQPPFRVVRMLVGKQAGCCGALHARHEKGAMVMAAVLGSAADPALCERERFLRLVEQWFAMDESAVTEGDVLSHFVAIQKVFRDNPRAERWYQQWKAQRSVELGASPVVQAEMVA